MMAERLETYFSVQSIYIEPPVYVKVATLLLLVAAIAALVELISGLTRRARAVAPRRSRVLAFHGALLLVCVSYSTCPLVHLAVS